jgi:hypothetical protein
MVPCSVSRERVLLMSLHISASHELVGSLWLLRVNSQMFGLFTAIKRTAFQGMVRWKCPSQTSGARYRQGNAGMTFVDFIG